MISLLYLRLNLGKKKSAPPLNNYINNLAPHVWNPSTMSFFWVCDVKEESDFNNL